jgi:outer membrane protein assembly factor BamB
LLSAGNDTKRIYETHPNVLYFGMAVSPLGDKDLIIVHPGSHGPLTAFDAKSGNIKWTATGDSAWASPIIVELGGTRQVVSMTQKSVISVAVADGALLWEHPWKSSGTASTMTPIVYGDTLIIASQKLPVAALRPTARDVGAACDFGQTHLRQGCLFVGAVDAELK